MAGHLRTELVLAALEMAVQQRKPKAVIHQAVIHHSDRGSPYTSLAFGHRCQEASVRPSVGSKGDCYDNALCPPPSRRGGSFFATLECELLDRHRYASKGEARLSVFRFIEGWYNVRRRHSGLAYASPLEYEEQYQFSLIDSNEKLSTQAG